MDDKYLPPEDLINWFKSEGRELPWRKTDDPYRIWVSEIMLQQTQVKTVEDYYDCFIERFPDVESLATAEQDEVLKLWEGLGYYSRARWLHEAAQTVVDEYDCRIPRDVDERESLKGIGAYTAAAIGAFAFDQQDPVIDGNVSRVVTRYYLIDQPVSRADTESRIKHYVEQSLKACDEPGLFSEAMMELGALVCTPSDPDCDVCPISTNCKANHTNRQEELPVTEERTERPHYEVTAGVIEENGEVLISRRPEDGMLGGLWEFPGGKQEEGETLRDAIKRELREELGIKTIVEDKCHQIPHQYSHLTINLHVFRCKIESGPPRAREDQQWEWVPVSELDDYAFPKSNHPILEQLIDNQTQRRNSS